MIYLIKFNFLLKKLNISLFVIYEIFIFHIKHNIMFLSTSYAGLKNGKKQNNDIYKRIDALDIIISCGTPEQVNKAKYDKKILKNELKNQMQKKIIFDKEQKISKYKKILLEIIRKKHIIRAYLYTSEYKNKNNIKINTFYDGVKTTIKNNEFNEIKKANNIKLTEKEKCELNDNAKKIVDSKNSNINSCYCI